MINSIIYSEGVGVQRLRLVRDQPYAGRTIKVTVPFTISEPVRSSERVGLLNPAFVYRNAASTNIRETFDRVRAQRGSK